MAHSFGYVLNRRPYRDSSLLVDIFTQEYGRICCVARPAKKRGKIVKGNLEPFRYNYFQWIGKGDVQTLTEADERGRHTIPPSELMLGLYLNELQLLLTRQHVPMPELFSAYKYTLHKLSDSQINKQILMRFELYLLTMLGYSLDAKSNTEIHPKMRYLLTRDEGLIETSSNNSIIETKLLMEKSISGQLLMAIQDLPSLSEKQWQQLRNLLDAVFQAIAPRTIHSRQLLKL